MVAVPALLPVIKPVAAPIEALVTLLLVHVPPVGVVVYVSVAPTHKAFVVGVNAAGRALTVTTVVRIQPAALV